MNKNQQPIFSVILPTYNRAHLLGRAIHSVLAQTYQDFELIIIDDASSDNTQEVVEAFQDNRIVYIQRDHNGGSSATRNTGICRARGKYVSFLDDDDEFLPTFLAQTYQVFEPLPENIGFVWGGICLVEDSPKGEIFLEEKLWHPTFNDREQARMSLIETQKIGTGYGLTIRTSCFATTGMFDESLSSAIDTEFIIRLARHFDFEIIPAVLVKVHHHAGFQLTKHFAQRAIAFERIIEKNFDYFRQHSNLWVAYHYKAGVSYYYSNNKPNARKLILRALQRDFFNLKTWKGLFLFEILGTPSLNLRQILSPRNTKV